MILLDIFGGKEDLVVNFVSNVKDILLYVKMDIFLSELKLLKE